MRLSKLFILFLVILLAGCASEYPQLKKVDPLPLFFNCRVVLLPFIGNVNMPRGENIFLKAFATEMKNVGGFDLIPEGDVQNLYQQLKLYRRTIPNESHMRVIGNRLDAQIIVLGEIVEMDEVDTGGYVDTRITVSVRIHEASSGNVLWSTYHKRKGEEYRNVMHYGRVNTITGLSRRMANEIITMWTKEGLNQCIDQ